MSLTVKNIYSRHIVSHARLKLIAIQIFKSVLPCVRERKQVIRVKSVCVFFAIQEKSFFLDIILSVNSLLERVMKRISSSGTFIHFINVAAKERAAIIQGSESCAG